VNLVSRIIAVTGGRDYRDRATVFRVLDAERNTDGVTLLVHGGANGADLLADEWAVSRKVNRRVYYADWSHGLSAGPRRNANMLRESDPHLLVAFPGGRGTANCVTQAERMGIRVLRIT